MGSLTDRSNWKLS